MTKRYVGVLAAVLIATASTHVASAADGNGALTGSPSTAAVPDISMLLGPVTINGPWLEFGFGGVGTFATGCIPADPTGITNCAPSSGGNSAILGTPPWTLTAPSAVQLTVTDAFASGDQFEVFDNNSSIGSTSAPVLGSICADPVPCLANPAFSHEVFTLGPGSHSLTIKTIASPFLPALGAAFFRIDTFTFAGQPGLPNCVGISVSSLVQQFGNLAAAAKFLGYPEVRTLQSAISAFCEAPQ
jgi:hypothetical protein